jgi:hypothetical protein
MPLNIPSLRDGYLRQIVACWHVPAADVSDPAGIEGTHIVKDEGDGAGIRGRFIFHDGSMKVDGVKVDVVHAHVEFASTEVFRKKVPAATKELDEVLGYLARFSECKTILSASFSAMFKLPLRQLPIGSILWPALRASSKEKGAVLSNGTFSINSKLADSIEFDIIGYEDDEPFFWVTIEGDGDGPISIDALTDAARQMASVFNAYVLATEPTRESDSATSGSGQ